ncbi:MAG: hypothetical protein GX171_06705 [Clostridiales bacterium]|nr:hypothetical protein [Clostridiales bacterium]
MECLRLQGVEPEVICSMPDRDLMDQHKRTARVVCIKGHQLLYSWFQDAQPEEE